MYAMRYTRYGSPDVLKLDRVDTPLLGTNDVLIQVYAAGANDTFVAKLSPSGELLLQSYLGEAGDDQANALALDTQGNAYLAGFASADFGPQVMVKKIKADGSAQVYQAFFVRATRGFAKGSSVRGIAVDGAGNAYLVGKTNTVWATRWP